MLRQLSREFRQVVRRRDTLARIGGDEFGILLEYCSSAQARRTAEEIIERIKGFEFTWQGETFHIGVSIGIAEVTSEARNVVDLIKQADVACYLAKYHGRNRYHVFHHEDDEVASHFGEVHWVTQVNRAFENNRFSLYLQSICSSVDGEGCHYEALLRMNLDDGQVILPVEFLPATERYNKMAEIDAWVISEVFRVLRGSPRFLENLGSISINLSGPSLNDRDCLAQIKQCFDESGIAPQKICFEITETVAIKNLSRAAIFIKELKDKGCNFSLDDFGSGLSSFGYLKNLPVDYLKIDGMFVKDMSNDKMDYAMVKSINDIGHIMGMKTIAECVENEGTKRVLKELGVDYFQGFYIDIPTPILEVVKEIENASSA